MMDDILRPPALAMIASCRDGPAATRSVRLKAAVVVSRLSMLPVMERNGMEWGAVVESREVCECEVEVRLLKCGA